MFMNQKTKEGEEGGSLERVGSLGRLGRVGRVALALNFSDILTYTFYLHI